MRCSWLPALAVTVASVMGVAASADVASIFKMPVNNRIWEVYETNPLTSVSEGRAARVWVSPNGANVAYVTITPEASRLCVRSVSGGKASVIAVAGRDPGVAGKPDSDKRIRWDLDQLDLVWSTDSRLVAFPVFDDEPVGESAKTRDWTWIVTFTAEGEQKTSFPLPRALELVGDIQWSHDVRRIAMVVKPASSSGPASSSILLLDLYGGAAQPIYTHQGGVVSLQGWSKGGKALSFTAPVADGESQLFELDLESRKAVPVEKKMASEVVTDDWNYRLSSTDTGLVLESRRNTKRFIVSSDPTARFLGFTPNDLVSYTRSCRFADEAQEREEQLISLWLSRPLQAGVNNMCVATDIDPGAVPAWSLDSSVVGYVSEGRLWTTRINRRQPTLVEKVVYRMVMDLPEEKKVALSQATALAKALAEYRASNDGRLPAVETLVSDLRPYIKEPMVTHTKGKFTDFTYTPPDTPLVTGRPVDVGYIDTGGAWRVIISSDGKARMEGK